MSAPARFRLDPGRIEAVHVENRHQGDDGGQARVVAQRDYPRRQTEQAVRLAGLGGLADLLGLAGPLDLADLVNLELEKPLAEIRMLYYRKVIIQARAEPHDVCRILEVPGHPPLIVQRSNAAADEVGPNHVKHEPG